MDNVTVGLNFGSALDRLRQGAKLRRAGWNGTGMAIGVREPEGSTDMDRPYIWIRGVDGKRVPWTPSQVDILATDWEVVDE